MSVLTWPPCEPRSGVSLVDGLQDPWPLQYSAARSSLSQLPAYPTSNLPVGLKTCSLTYTTVNLEREFNKEMRQVTVIIFRNVLTRNLLTCSFPI